MVFAQPEMLWLLAVLTPLLLWFAWWTWRRKQALIREFVQSRLLAQLTVGVSARRQKIRLGLLIAAVPCLLLALARPQFGLAQEEVRQRGLDILVAIDVSRSMLATDLPPNRLARAKLAALDLMRVARSDRLGLIAFAGTAFLQCPLTLDDNAFAESVNSLDVNTIPQGGTALAEAIDTAIRAVKESGENFKVLVIFTDGEDHEPGLEEAVKQAADAGLRIFPVGVGTPEGDRLRVIDDKGRTTYLSDTDGKPVVSKLNMDVLQKIATPTKGVALKLGGPDPMRLLYEVQLAPLPRNESSSRWFRQYHERFQWPLGLAIVLLVAELFIHERRRVARTEPHSNTSNAELKRAVALLVVFLLPLAAQASGDQARRAYESGRFGEAQREYERLLQKNPKDPRLLYNAGTSAYRAGRYEEAIQNLDSAVLASKPDLMASAYYNLANAYFRAGEAAAQPTNRIASWEESIRHYDSSLKLNPEDADAKYNRELVTRKLEELRQQMQQQQQQNQSSDQKQDQKQDQQNSPDQKKQDSQDSKNSQNKKDQPQPSPDQQKNEKSQEPKPDADQSKQKRPGDPENEKGEQADTKPKPGDKEQGDPQPKARNEQPPAGKPGAAAAAAAKPGQMTPEQARQLLEAARSEERPMIFIPPEARKAQPGTHKEW